MAAQNAHITSVEAIEAFRANLVIYQSKARPALEEISAEATRVRLWLENEKRPYWEQQLRRRHKALEEARAALFSASMTKLREVTTAEQFAVQRAKRAVDEAEAKLQVIKKWGREFETRMGPLTKQLQGLESVLTHSVPMAIAHLAEVVRMISEYAEIHGNPGAGPLPTTVTIDEKAEPGEGKSEGGTVA